ncbi:ABC transporter ATP-binding protein [Conexibacter sp. CPCC 206217]|uniref:ABC transporter ATP-binding protein n=1 Tax=Conexibacter sp. CPCC 206217 TaxID=3064574 RepID=UPI00271B3122|nr:sn-glycerol-3-phosphate ABC transporter ATP-binding protein UgpC [Conexibacter sp. CPCC 206217]MDO8211052.1 sn-glycerol-3-phosphate ABC transporter ATP-binding protein UgpC [Conexibacter sp. CPCC 206217]
MAMVSFNGVGKVYPDGTTAVQALDLTIPDGELLVFVGPSGCGKTTALRMVAGLEQITSGEISIDGRVVNDLAPKARDVAMIFQSYALYPHMTVFENIAFPLRAQGMPRKEVRATVEHVATRLGLEALIDRRPGRLSGGQRQRVAMGRAIVRRPKVFAMDEPLSNLDAKLRGQMRVEVMTLQRELGVTTIYVTHDQLEAMTMGHRIAVMRDGVLQQCATPQEVFDRPANLFVAGFLGSPSMNLLSGRIERDGDELVCRIGGQSLMLRSAQPALAAHAGRELTVGVRPEHLELAPAGAGGLAAACLLIETLGSEQLVHAELPGEGGAIPLVARLDSEQRVRAGAPLTFAVRPDRLRFFDPDHGRAVDGAPHSNATDERSHVGTAR